MKPEELTLSPQLFLIDQKELQIGFHEFRFVAQENIKPLALYALCSEHWAYREGELKTLYLPNEKLYIGLRLRELSLWAPSPPSFWMRLQAGPFLQPGRLLAAIVENSSPFEGCRVALLLLGLVVREKSQALLPPKLRIESEGGEQKLFYEEQSGGSVEPEKASLFLGQAESELFKKGGRQ